MLFAAPLSVDCFGICGTSCVLKRSQRMCKSIAESTAAVWSNRSLNFRSSSKARCVRAPCAAVYLRLPRVYVRRCSAGAATNSSIWRRAISSASTANNQCQVTKRRRNGGWYANPKACESGGPSSRRGDDPQRGCPPPPERMLAHHDREEGRDGGHRRRPHRLRNRPHARQSQDLHRT